MDRICLAAVLVLLCFGSCNQKTGSKSDISAPMKQEISLKVNELAQVKDPVCQMTLENGSIADTTLYQGKIYGFCSAECKAEFLKNPDSHLAQK